MRARDLDTSRYDEEKGEIISWEARKLCCAKVVTLLASLFMFAGTVAATAESEGPFSERVRGDGPPVDGIWGWFASSVRPGDAICWSGKNLLCTGDPRGFPLVALPPTGRAYAINEKANSPRYNKSRLGPPILKVGTWIQSDKGYACMSELMQLTCKNRSGHGFHISSVDRHQTFFGPQDKVKIRDLPTFNEGVRAHESEYLFTGGETSDTEVSIDHSERKTVLVDGAPQYSCKFSSAGDLICERAKPWLGVVLPKKGSGKVLEARVHSSNQGAPTQMGGKYLRADLWWAHKSEFACAVDQERVLKQDSGKFERIFELVCENSEQHGFKLTKDTVEFF